MSDEEKPDDSEPTLERQAELRAAYDANVAAGKAPYKGVEIHTRGELAQVMQERDWSGEPNAGGKDRPNLSGADLIGANLSGAKLAGANLSSASPAFANLSGADLERADLSGASLIHANLSGAFLIKADLSGTGLLEAILSGASLIHANLSGADLIGANLSGVDLREALMEASTKLTGAKLDSRTRLADVVWNGVPVTRLNWEDVDTLGEEWVAHQAKDKQGEPKDKATRLQDFQNAVMANRQVATLLRSQGLNEPADRFTYRAQLLQQQVLWRQRRFGAYLFSRLLDALMGYGYRIGRIVFAYVAVVCGFAVLSLAGVALSGHAVGVQEAQTALVASLQTFHGHTFGNIFAPHGAVAFIEALCGLVIESTFIAMLVQRLRAGSGE